jgi:phage portal protein BeeE
VVERIVPRLERRLRYTYTLPNGRPFVIPTERVLHLRQRSADGLVGYSPIGEQREAIGLALALEQYAGRFFGNDSRPGGVLEVQGRLSPDAAQRLKTQWETAHQGFSRAYRVAVLEEGVAWKAVGLPPQDAQFLEQRKFQRGEIASIFRVPPHMIGDVERATSWGSGIEQQSIGFVQYTLGPRLKRIEARADQSLLAPEEADRYYSEFAVDGLLRGDSRSRAQLLQTMRQNGVLNADEWRALENLNALPDGQGQVYLAPANLIPLEQMTAPAAPPPAATPPATLTAGTNGTPSGSPPAPTPRASRGEERTYACRACGHPLFSSADERGRITTICPDRRCREHQTVLVGAP